MSKAIKIDEFVFTDLNKFSEEVKKKELDVDIGALLAFTGNYVKELPDGLIMKIVDYDEDPNKIVIFFDKATMVYSSKPISSAELDNYKDVVGKPHGLTTVLTLLLLTESVDSFKRKREKLMELYKTLEENFDERTHRELTRTYQEYHDRLEDLSDILLKLQERSISQVEPQLASFDYSILQAEVNNLFDRAKMRLSMLKDLAFGYELKVSRQLNERVEVLSDVVKRLTAITVILMAPNLIASHYGMNFTFMPELDIPWAYPVVLMSQLAVVLVTLLVFRKKRWI